MPLKKPLPWPMPRPAPAIPRKLNRLAPLVEEGDEPPLTGMIRGRPAKSKAEERVARSLDNIGENYIYEYEIITALRDPTQPRNIDFLAGDVALQPIEVKGEIGHESPEAREEDALREQFIEEALQREGIYKRIVSIWYYDTEDQESSDARVLEVMNE